MSLDTRYIIQYEGPFGENELENQLEALNCLSNSFGFEILGYDTIQGEVKNSADEEIIEIVKKSTPIQILSRRDGGRWKEIWSL